MLEALALTVPVVLAGERSILHVPSAEEVRIQKIAKTDNERDWPFSVDSGNLTCVWSAGQRLVLFFEARPENREDGEDFKPRHVIVSADPFDLTIGNIADRALFAPMVDVAELVRRVAPYAVVGERLCDQPPGTIIGPGEL